MHVFTCLGIIGLDPLTLLSFINVPTLTIDPDREYIIWLTVSNIFEQCYQYNLTFLNHISNDI